jgi:hypothetical protein
VTDTTACPAPLTNTRKAPYCAKHQVCIASTQQIIHMCGTIPQTATTPATTQEQRLPKMPAPESRRGCL